MLNKNDPLIAAVQKVMQTNQAERDAVRVVNEKFGVVDRRALPRERQHEWDSAYAKILTEGVEALDEKIDPSEYSEKQKRLAGTAGDKTRIDGPDLRHVRKHGGKHIEEEAGHVSTKVKLDNHGSDIHAKHEKEFGVKITHPADGKGPSTVSGPKKGMQGYLNRVYDSGFSPERAHPHVFSEEKKMKGDDPCWDNYEMIGMKKKGGKEVPNCVPVKEEGVPGKAIPGDVVTGSGSVTPVPVPKPKPTIGDGDRAELTNKIKSIVKEATENQKNKVGKVMREFKKRKLHSGKGGPVVKDKKQAVAIALSQAGLAKAKKKLEEGFNNRHDLSVTASVEKQVVAGQLNEQETYADYDPAKETKNKFAKLSGATSGKRVRDFISQRKFLRSNPPQGSIKSEPGNYRVNKAIDQAKAFASGAVGYGSDYEKFYPRAAETGKLVGVGSMLLPGRPVVAAGQAAAKAPAVATQTTNVVNKFRANLANRRYNVSGAQQKPPQRVAQQSAPQGSVPSVAQGTGQGNRLAAARRPENGPWGGTPPAAATSKLRVPSGGFAANLQRARQQAQASRAGVNTAQATQAATRAASARQSSQALGGLSKTTNATNALRARQSSQALGGFGRATSSLGNLVRKNPKLAAGAAAGAAMTGFAATQVGNQPSSAAAKPSPGVTARKIEATPRKVSDTEIMNAPQYKQAVKDVGGPEAARKIQPGTNVAGVGPVAKGETIWSKVKSQLEKKPVSGFEARTGGAGR